MGAPVVARRSILQLEGGAMANRDKGASMICQKCGFGYMVDDSHHDLRVFKCWVCAERIYRDYPKRSGALACSRCGSAMEEKNALKLCKDCARFANLQTHHLRGRTYG